MRRRISVDKSLLINYTIKGVQRTAFSSQGILQKTCHFNRVNFMNRKPCWVVSGFILFSILFLLSCSKITAPADVIPPVTPGAFILLGGGDGEARFRWAPNSELDFKSYNIYRSVSAPTAFVRIAEIAENEYVDRFLSYDSTYFYYITASDNAGNESQPSGVLDVRPVNISSPPSPSAVAVYGRNNTSLNQVEFKVSWIPPTISDLGYFRVYRSAAADFQTDAANLVDSTAVSIFSDENVKPGDLFYYRVTCVDLGGRASVASFPGYDRILDKVALVTPSNRTVQPQKLSFTWQPVANAVGYQVFVGRAPLSNIIWTSKTITGQQLQYAGSALSSDAIYYWWVGAFSKRSSLDQAGTLIEPEVNSTSEIWSFFVR